MAREIEIAGQTVLRLDPEPCATRHGGSVGAALKERAATDIPPSVGVCGSGRSGAAPGAARSAGSGVLLGAAPPAAPGAVRMFPAHPDEIVKDSHGRIVRTIKRPGAVVSRTAGSVEIADLQIRGERRRRPDPLPRSEHNAGLVAAWVKYLGPAFSESAAANVTVTYSDQYGYDHGLMLVRNVAKDLDRLTREIRREGFPWVAGIEYHPSTHRAILHAHMMLGGDWLPADLDRLKAHVDATRGFCVAKPVTDAGGCAAYCAKHLLKQRGEDTLVLSLHQKPLTRHAKRLLDLAPGPTSPSRRKVVHGTNAPGHAVGQGAL